MTTREFSDRWAYDIDKNPIDNGEIWDVNVINQSIEMILGTIPGERLFNPSFGFGIQIRIFESMNSEIANSLLNDIAAAIRRWEDRIIVLESSMRIIANVDEHSIIIVIPYRILRTGIESVFKKKIITSG